MKNLKRVDVHQITIWKKIWQEAQLSGYIFCKYSIVLQYLSVFTYLLERKKTHCTKHLHDHVRNTTECKSILLLSYTGTVEKRERLLGSKKCMAVQQKKVGGLGFFLDVSLGYWTLSLTHSPRCIMM